VPEPITLAEMPVGVAWNVQGDASRMEFTDQVTRQFSVTLPTRPNTTARSSSLTIFWLGPRSWLLVAANPASPLTDFTAKRDALNQAGGALFDLSASRVAYRIAGEHARSVLESGCPLDLHPRAFRAGACAQSVFGRISVLFYRPDETPTWIIMVARSFARDTWEALQQSARQYGLMRDDELSRR
jgi:sarcosine oxidase subunit gamma